MKIPKPRFELARVYADGTKEVEIVPVTDIPLSTTTGRRGFLATALTAAAVLGIIGCPRRIHLAHGAEKTAMKEADCGELRGHIQKVRALVISLDGSMLASGSEDQTIKLWDLPPGTLSKTLEANTDKIYALAISPDGNFLVSSSRGDKNIKLRSLPSCALRNNLEGHKNWVRALVISPDSRTLVSGSEDRTIKLWDLPAGTLRQSLKGHTDSIYALAITPDGHTLASGSEDQTIMLWNLSSGTFRQTLKGHTGAIRALAISPDGHTLASGSEDKSVKLWDLPAGELSKTLNGHTDTIYALAISPDGRTLATGSGDQTIKMWDCPSGKFKTCLVDLAAIQPDIKGMTYQERNEYGQPVTYTRPCGSPIPPGATCICNCVPGTYGTASSEQRNIGYTYCSCNKVCVCIPVCQAHRLQHEDQTVRTMAEETLLMMGSEQFDYMQWAAENPDPCLQPRISQVITEIRNGVRPNLARWPSPQVLESHLDHADPVISLMAAQLLHHMTHHGWELSSDLTIRVDHTLEAGQAMDWRLRAH